MNRASYRLGLQVTLLLLVVIAFISLSQAVRNRAIQEFNDQQMILVQRAGESIQAFFALNDAALKFLAIQPEIIHMSPRGVQMIADLKRESSAFIVSVMRMESAGIVLSAFPEQEILEGQDLSYHDHVKILQATRSPIMSDVFISSQGFQGVAYHVPVFDGDQFVGSVAILIDFKAFVKSYIENLSFTGETRAWMLTAKGTELFCGVEDHIGKNIEDTQSQIELALRMLEGGEGSWIYYTDQRKPWQPKRSDRRQAVFSAIHIKNTFWSLAIAAPEREILTTISRFRVGMFGLMILFLALTMYYMYSILKAQTVLKEEDVRRKGEIALKASEAKFRSYMENSTDGIFIVDGEMNYVEVNPAASTLTGFSESELLRMKIKDLVTEAGAESAMLHFQAIQRYGSAQADLPYRHKDGSEGMLAVSAVQLNENRYLGFVRDITERMETQQELEKTVRDKEVLLTEIHHRTKNNMAVILGMVNMLSYGNESADVKIALETFKHRIMAMSLVHEQLYREESFSEIDSVEFFESLYQNLHNSYVNSDQQIQVELDIKIKQLSINQAIPLGFVLNEILTNSFKHAFSNRDKGRIQVRLWAEEDGIAMLGVLDDGDGFDSSKYIDDPGGVGLGLIKLLIEDQLGGSLRIDSSKGTSYLITFPLNS